MSGKGSGYYGCANAMRHSCENRVLIARKRLEEKLLETLNVEVLRPELLERVYAKTAEKIKEHFSGLREELRLKRIELNRAETRVYNFIEFIASGRATPALADALAQAEQQVKELSPDVAAMDRAFAPPPKAWIVDRVAKLQALLAQRTEPSALALRRLTGPLTLTPEVGRACFRVRCSVDSLNHLVAEDGSNLLQLRRGRDSNSSPGFPRRFCAVFGVWAGRL